jgi:hypothetical protein
MKIKKNDIEQSKDSNDLLFDLIEKYYPEYDDNSFDKLDLVSQTFVLIVNADGQINNGGIIQFIDNGTGNYFHETIDAAKRIQSEVLVNILTRTAAQFPNEQIPKDWDERRELIDKLNEQFCPSIPFNELNEDAKKKFLENYDNSIPLEEILIELESEWGKAWEDLDGMYYENSISIYQSLIDYLKSNANLIN